MSQTESESAFDDLCGWARIVLITVKRLKCEQGQDYREFISECAVTNANWQRMAFEERRTGRGDGIDYSRPYNPDPSRCVSPFLRHNATNYDELLQILNSFERDDIVFDGDKEAEPDPDKDFAECDTAFEQAWCIAQDALREEKNAAYGILRERVQRELAFVYPEFEEELEADIGPL